jgi:hypothetical protein
VRQIFDRYMEITRNFGLKESVPLAATDGQSSAVTLKADADNMKLFLTLDLTGVDLVDDAVRCKAYELLLNLDARSLWRTADSGRDGGACAFRARRGMEKR